jgi:GNAT superfamily N-acetyltransferase
MGDLKLRRATERDSEFAYRVKTAAFRQYVEQVWGWDEDEQRQLHAKRFAAQDSRIVSVADEDVGVMAVVVEPGCLKLNQLFILPERQSRGIGGECMSLLIDEARRLGLPIRLGVLRVNSRALVFYERCGFVRTGETETHILMQRNVCTDSQ